MEAVQGRSVYPVITAKYLAGHTKNIETVLRDDQFLELPEFYASAKVYS